MFDRSRRRLAIWFTLSMGSILVLFAFTLYQRQVAEQKRAFEAEIQALTQKLEGKVKYQQQGKSWQIVPNTAYGFSRNLTSESRLDCIRWYDARQRLIESFGECSRSSLMTGKWQTVKYPQHSHPQQRILTLALKKDRYLAGYLQVARSLEAVHNSQRRSLLFLAIGIPATLAITGIVGWLLAGYAMRPVKHSYEQLQRFTADASHELRAPVSAILSNAQVGLLAPIDDPTQPRQRLENIVTQSKYMSDLITNLLFLARHQGKLNPQDVATIDLVELLNSLAQEYQIKATDKGLEFQLDVPIAKDTKGDRVIAYPADRDLLQQAINNLLDNAIKYTPAGEVVTLKLETKPRRVLITVRDTGVGIPEADLTHIFDRFYRVDKARTRQTGGFGLGLAIAQQIIQAHGGKITVESEVGKGTAFQICLPSNFNRR